MAGNGTNTGQSGSKANKLSLEQVLGASNFDAYKQIATVIDSYMQTKDHPGFSVVNMGNYMYNALLTISKEVTDPALAAMLEMKRHALEESIKYKTITKESLDGIANYLKDFLPPYLDKIKDSIGADNHKSMAMGIMLNIGKYPDEFKKISSVKGGAKPAQLSLILDELNNDLNNNDTSKIASYYKKLSSPEVEKAYVKLGMTPDNAKKAFVDGNKCYADLVNSLSENAKIEHMTYVQKILMSEIYRQSKNIDGDALKQALESSDPVNYLNMLPLAVKQGSNYLGV